MDYPTWTMADELQGHFLDYFVRPRPVFTFFAFLAFVLFFPAICIFFTALIRAMIFPYECIIEYGIYYALFLVLAIFFCLICFFVFVQWLAIGSDTLRGHYVDRYCADLKKGGNRR